MFEAEIVKDSINASGRRLTTFKVTYPRVILAEVLTHRVFSRNTASSRAVPYPKMKKKILEGWYSPVLQKANKGMQGKDELVENAEELLQMRRDLLDKAFEVCDAYHEAGVHKTEINRLIEPWMFITQLISATHWEHFFALRDQRLADIPFQTIARMMHKLYDDSKPEYLKACHWHIPYILPEEEELPLSDKLKISVARCARVSYFNPYGQCDVSKDLALYERLKNPEDGPPHASPFEHQAYANGTLRCGNFEGWIQYRKTMKGEFRNEYVSLG